MIVAIEEICFEKVSGCVFNVRNSKGTVFGIKSEAGLHLNDKKSNVDEVLKFFKWTRRTIAEMEFREDDDYHPYYINFMALE